jgi:hypothetical protein
LDEAVEPGRWRRCLITTTPIEIAARIAITIRIGTTGDEEEEEELSFAGVAPPGAFVPPAAPPEPFEPPELAGCVPVEPLPGLLWPEPPLPPVLGLPFAADDGALDED